MNEPWRIGDWESQSVVSRDRIRVRVRVRDRIRVRVRVRVRVRDSISRVRHGTSTCAADDPRAVRMLPLTRGKARTYLTRQSEVVAGKWEIEVRKV
jgi:hypothetical protein